MIRNVFAKTLMLGCFAWSCLIGWYIFGLYSSCRYFKGSPWGWNSVHPNELFGAVLVVCVTALVLLSNDNSYFTLTLRLTDCRVVTLKTFKYYWIKFNPLLYTSQKLSLGWRLFLMRNYGRFWINMCSLVVAELTLLPYLLLELHVP